MLSGQRPVRDTVAIHVHIPVKLFDRLELLGTQDLAAPGLEILVPFEFRTHPVIHADIEIRQHHDGRLQFVGKVECGQRHVKTLFRIRWEQQNMAGIAV